MIELRLQIPELAELEELARQAPEILLDELETAMERAMLDLEGEVVTRVPVDRATLRNAIGSRVERDRDAVRGFLEVSPSAAPHAAVVEEGRRPGKFPPVRAIEAWVYRKGLGASVSRSGRIRRPGPNILADPTARPDRKIREIAFLVARKIAREGTEGKHMFRDGAQAALPTVRRRFRGAIRRAAKRIVG